MTVAKRFSALRYAVVTVTLLAASAAHGKAAAPPFLQVAGVIDAPNGFVEMCKSDSSFCGGSRTGIDQGNTPDTVTSNLQSVPPPPIFIVSVPFDIDAPSLRLQIGWPALASPLMSCASFVGVFGTNDGGLLPEVLAPLSVRDAPGLRGMKFGQSRSPFAPPMPCNHDIDTFQVALSDTGAIAKPLSPWVVSRAPSPHISSATEADEQSLLQGINRLVNGRVHQGTDLEIYGQAEVWRRSGVGKGAAGDCEDLAIEKRFELVDAGFPPDRLAFAVVYAHGIGLHTVLVAHLSSGDYVLDSRTPYIQPWADTPYSWIGIQSTEDPMAWHAVMGGSRKI